VYGATYLLRPLLEASPLAHPQAGLASAVYDGRFAHARDLDQATPATRGVATTIALDQFSRMTNYGATFEGYVRIDSDDFYQFAVESDDGALLEIDGETVIDNDGYHGPRLVTGHIPLRVGFHRLKLRYFQGEGGAVLDVRYARARGALEHLAPAALYHGATDGAQGRGGR